VPTELKAGWAHLALRVLETPSLIAIPTTLFRIPTTLYKEIRKEEKLLEDQERDGFISY